MLKKSLRNFRQWRQRVSQQVLKQVLNSEKNFKLKKSLRNFRQWRQRVSQQVLKQVLNSEKNFKLKKSLRNFHQWRQRIWQQRVLKQDFFYSSTAKWATASSCWVRHKTVGRTPLYEGSTRRRDLYLKTHNTRKRLTSKLRVGFEPAIPASNRPQILASDRSATGIGYREVIHGIFCAHFWIKYGSDLIENV